MGGWRTGAAMVAIAAASLAAVLGGCAPTPVGLTLSGAQQDQRAQAQAYLDGLTRFSARFTQSGSYGAGSGILWVDRPGRLRIEYAGPRPEQMVANAGTFTVFTPTNGATTTMPVSRTPLGLLLAEHVSLSGTVLTTGFTDTGDTLSLTLADAAHPAQGSLTVTLAKAPTRLVGVAATDQRGRTLAMALSDLDTNPVLTPALFAPPGTPTPGS